MYRNRTKTLNFAVLVIYAVFSFCGLAFHQWSHHGPGSLCSACQAVPPGSEHGCDEVSDVPHRHLCGSHSDSKSCCHGHRASESRRTQGSDSEGSDSEGSDSEGSDSEGCDSEGSGIAWAKAKPHFCEICSMLSLLSQSWGSMTSEVASETHLTGLLFETSSFAWGVDSWMARSRAPPFFALST